MHPCNLQIRDVSDNHLYDLPSENDERPSENQYLNENENENFKNINNLLNINEEEIYNNSRNNLNDESNDLGRP